MRVGNHVELHKGLINKVIINTTLFIVHYIPKQLRNNGVFCNSINFFHCILSLSLADMPKAWVILDYTNETIIKKQDNEDEGHKKSYARLNNNYSNLPKSKCDPIINSKVLISTWALSTIMVEGLQPSAIVRTLQCKACRTS